MWWGSSEPAAAEPAMSAVLSVEPTGGDTLYGGDTGRDTLEERMHRLEAQAKQHSDSIAQLSLSIRQLQQQAPSSDASALAVPDSLSIQAVKGDVEQVVDAMRRDLASQRKMMDDFHEKLQPIRTDFLSNRDALERLKSIDPRSLRSEFVSTARFSEVTADLKLELKTAVIANQNNNMNNSGMTATSFGLQAIGETITAAVESTLGKQQGSMGASQSQDLGSIKRGLETFFVAKGAFNETVIELRSSSKNDLAMLHSLLEHTALKAGYFAIAASECSPDEKTLLFETLKGKEKVIGSMPKGAPPGVQYPQSMSNICSAVNDLMQSSPPPLHSANRDASTLATRNDSRQSQFGELVINLQRFPNMKLGMTLDGRDESSLIISGISDGLVSLHNAAAVATSNPSQALQVGDRIVAVNGTRGPPAVLIQETKRDQTVPMLELTVLRGRPPLTPTGESAPASRRGTPMPGEVLVTLDSSSGKKLGLSVDCDDHQTLLISRINPGGLMDAWNDAHPGQPIMSRDRIVMANGKRGDPKAILEETQRGGELWLGIIRNSTHC